MNKIKYRSLLILFFSILPIVDSINGFMLTEHRGDIGQLYKISLIILVTIYFFRMKTFTYREVIGLIFPIIYTILSMSLNFIIKMNRIPTYDHAIKLIYNLTLMQLLFILIKRKNIDKYFFEKIFTNNSFFVLLVILIPWILNMGYSVYSTGQGYKGFYYAQNELNAILLILYLYNINKSFKDVKMTNFLITILIGFCLVLLETKSSIILGTIISLIFIVYYIVVKKFKYKIVVVISIFCLIPIIVKMLQPIVESFLYRQYYLSQNFNNSFFAYFSSGRVLYMINAFNYLKTNSFFILKLIIGNGFIGLNLVEMDIIDIFLYLGIIGVVYILIIMYKLIINTIKNKNSTLDLFSLFIILTFSFFTGHVLFMTTSGIYFVLFCCYKSTNFNN